VRKREAERIRYLAEYDTLTGRANRHTQREYLHAKFAETKTGSREIALLLMDLDNFKEINDTLGHACGDQLLCAVANRLNVLVKDAGLVARLNGDEFVIVISGAGVADKAKSMSEEISLAFGIVPLSIGSRQIHVKTSAWRSIRIIVVR
jgi:diguanylate cyclase (GGDEF)-like protein